MKVTVTLIFAIVRVKVTVTPVTVAFTNSKIIIEGVTMTYVLVNNWTISCGLNASICKN